jgi:hypothetical protein
MLSRSSQPLETRWNKQVCGKHHVPAVLPANPSENPHYTSSRSGRHEKTRLHRDSIPRPSRTQPFAIRTSWLLLCQRSAEFVVIESCGISVPKTAMFTCTWLQERPCWQSVSLEVPNDVLFTDQFRSRSTLITQCLDQRTLTVVNYSCESVLVDIITLRLTWFIVEYSKTQQYSDT